MKKIFLLTLISVLVFSAITQIGYSTPEVVAKINISQSIDDHENPDVENGWWIFFYARVRCYYDFDGSYQVECTGWGWKMCWGAFWDIFKVRGISAEAFDGTCDDLKAVSEEQIAKGVFQGTASKKIASSDPQTGRSTYFIFQMNWNHDPKKPYNGKSEITVTKTDKLAF